MKGSMVALALVVIAAVPLGLTVGAQDRELEGLLDDQKSMVLRVHNVADLTVRLTDFIRPNLIMRSAGSEMDEDQPFFGKAQEGEVFFSNIEEITELIEQNVRPEIWSHGGPTIRIVGSHALVVTAPKDVQNEVEAYIRALRESVGRLVTLELRVLEIAGDVPGKTLYTAEEGKALMGQSGVRLALSSRITAFSGQMVSLYRAVQRAFVQDHDVEVAQTASIADPIVSVQQLGLSFDARCVTRRDSHVVVDLRACLTRAKDSGRMFKSIGGGVNVPSQRLVNFQSTVSIPVGGYALVGSGKTADGVRWALLLSPHVDRIGAKGGAK